MSATNSTANYQLPIFLPTDKPAWLVDFNGAMNKIDSGIADAKTTGSSAQSTAESAITQVSGVKTTADTALANAATAQSTADSATTLANNATSVANAAQTTADDAKTAVDKFNGLSNWFHYRTNIAGMEFAPGFVVGTTVGFQGMALDYNPVLKILTLNFTVNFTSYNLTATITTPDGFTFIPVVKLPFTTTGYKKLLGVMTDEYVHNSLNYSITNTRPMAILTYAGSAWYGILNTTGGTLNTSSGVFFSCLTCNTSDLTNMQLSGWTPDEDTGLLIRTSVSPWSTDGGDK